MKLRLLNRSSSDNSSFTTKVNKYPCFLKVWHYHPELELVVILKSQGTAFIGDSMEYFDKGDVFLIGENTPHMWLNDKIYFKKHSKLIAQAIAIHFKKEFLGSAFFKTPEMIHILELFDRSRLGIKFLNINSKIKEDIDEMTKLKGYEKTISFLNILNNLSKHKEYKLLSNHGFINEFQIKKSKVLDKAHAYIFKNFNKDISLKEVANIANMNSSAFSRLFKKVNRKTYSRYLLELRIGYACKLLLEGKSNIFTICYDVGFNNISNFNRQFKLIMKCTPTEYLKTHTR